VPVKDLIGGAGARAPRPARWQPRYRHPDDASQQWTGRGRQPKWVKEWVDGGKVDRQAARLKF
jgi:DNA-binding protein H-NS